MEPFKSFNLNKLTKNELAFLVYIVDSNNVGDSNKYNRDYILDSFSKNEGRFRHYLEIINNEGVALPYGMPNTDENLLFHLAKYFCMSIESFDWIDTNNIRLCDFVWSYIQLMGNSIIRSNYFRELSISKQMIVPSSSKIPRPRPLLNPPGLEKVPRDSTRKKHSIIDFFNFLCFSAQDKKTFLADIKDRWDICSKRLDVVDWLRNDKDPLWAWNYLHKGISPSWFVVHDKKTDHVNGVITTFDLLNDIPDTRELLLTRMRSAWSQKAYRDKNNGKKTVSIVLSEDIINKLDFICENTDRRKNEVVTRLIKDEYDKVKKGGH